jgi:hypothetical protein
MVEILIAGVIGSLGIMAIRFWVRIHRKNAERLKYHRQMFFDAAERVVRDDIFADDRLKRLRDMAEEILLPSMFNKVFIAAVAVEREYRTKKMPPRQPPSPKEWLELMFHYLMAVSHMKLYRGFLLRAVLFSVSDPAAASDRADVLDRRVHAPQMITA